MSSEDNPDKGRSTKVKKPQEAARTQIEFVSMESEKVPRGKAKYRDPDNPFNTWGGQGKRPTWLRKYLEEGRELSEFEVHDED